MPFKSEKQKRLMYAAAEGKSEKVSAPDAKKFIKHSKRHAKGKRKK